MGIDSASNWIRSAVRPIGPIAPTLTPPSPLALALALARALTGAPPTLAGSAITLAAVGATASGDGSTSACSFATIEAPVVVGIESLDEQTDTYTYTVPATLCIGLVALRIGAAAGRAALASSAAGATLLVDSTVAVPSRLAAAALATGLPALGAGAPALGALTPTLSELSARRLAFRLIERAVAVAVESLDHALTKLGTVHAVLSTGLVVSLPVGILSVSRRCERADGAQDHGEKSDSLGALQ